MATTSTGSLISSYGSHVPEDKDQWLVQTPYGKAKVIRSRRQVIDNQQELTMREMELTDWITATDDSTATTSPSKKPAPLNLNRTKRSSRPRRPPTLFSTTKFPSIPPEVGSQVVCVFGRGVVTEIRKKDGIVVVLLSSWRLADRNRVTCYFLRGDVQVVRPKVLHEMTVYEKVEHAQHLKQQAAQLFASKDYPQALNTYSRAVDAVRYVQHKPDSSNHVRADLIVVMVTCSNNAATCCMQLGNKWDSALAFAKNALLLMDALESNKGKKIHSILNQEGFSDIKLFGEWRVKSYLVMARASAEKKDTEQALDVLKKAHDVIAAFTDEYKSATDAATKASVQRLLSNDKEVKRLHASCKERRKLEKKKEKQRAQAMFGTTNDKPAKPQQQPPQSSTQGKPTPATTSTGKEIEPHRKKDTSSSSSWSSVYSQLEVLTFVAGASMLAWGAVSLFRKK